MSANKDKGKDEVAGYVRKLTWILLTLVILGMFSYFRITGQLSQFIDGMRATDQPVVSQKAGTIITITQEETPRMIAVPAFQRLVYGVVETNVAYVVHVLPRDETDPTKILQFPIPARMDRPRDWTNPVVGGNYKQIGFTVDQTSAEVIGHIDYVFEPN